MAMTGLSVVAALVAACVLVVVTLGAAVVAAPVVVGATVVEAVDGPHADLHWARSEAQVDKLAPDLVRH